MSVDDLDEIYLNFENPLEKKLAEVRNELARARFQKPEKGETKLDQGSLGVNLFNYMKIVNNHYNVAVHPLGTLDYFPATEPDYNTCKLILMTDHFGRVMFDDSQIPSSNIGGSSGQQILLYGEPKLYDGFDRGYGDNTNTQKRQALRFNRPNSPTIAKEYIAITDQALTDPNKSLRVLDYAASGFSVFNRVKLDNFDNTMGTAGVDMTLMSKIDDNAGLYSFLVSVTATGKVRFQVINNGTAKFRQTTTTLTVGQEKEIFCVYDPAGGTDDLKLKIYFDGTLQTNEASTQGGVGSASDHNLYIGKRGSSDGGFIQGYLIYSKFFGGYKVSAAEAAQHFTNKLTIGNIAYGKVAVTEYPVSKNV